MGRSKILQAGKSYSFRQYFEMPYEPDEILAEFGYELTLEKLTLPKVSQTLERLPALRQQMEDVLPFVSLSSEMARREVLVSPVLMEVVRLCHCQLRIEYPLVVNDWLKGSLDYLLRSQASVAVVEAKRDDLSRGFTQLAIELIALAETDERDIVYGAVTIGEAWRFGKLNRLNRKISQDLTLYKVPDELEQVLATLVGIMQENPD
ncbi:MAG: hypothetical protein AAFX51_16700 [Cyanobacteria bacterium J06636_28]|mgnify:CR=1 FL=1